MPAEQRNLDVRRQEAEARLHAVIERARNACDYSIHVRRTNRKLKKELMSIPLTVLVRAEHGALELKVFGEGRRRGPLRNLLDMQSTDI